MVRDPGDVTAGVLVIFDQSGSLRISYRAENDRCLTGGVGDCLGSWGGDTKDHAGVVVYQLGSHRLEVTLVTISVLVFDLDILTVVVALPCQLIDVSFVDLIESWVVHQGQYPDLRDPLAAELVVLSEESDPEEGDNNCNKGIHSFHLKLSHLSKTKSEDLH